MVFSLRPRNEEEINPPAKIRAVAPKTRTSPVMTVLPAVSEDVFRRERYEFEHCRLRLSVLSVDDCAVVQLDDAFSHTP